jgi:hypothetical protein
MAVASNLPDRNGLRSMEKGSLFGPAEGKKKRKVGIRESVWQLCPIGSMTVSVHQLGIDKFVFFFICESILAISKILAKKVWHCNLICRGRQQSLKLRRHRARGNIWLSPAPSCTDGKSA